MAITHPMDAVRAIGLAVREIRVELGEPSDRTAVSIEDVIRKEYERWMLPAQGTEVNTAELPLPPVDVDDPEEQ